MATSRTWTVVEFLDSHTVEAIPSTWLYENKCYWPPLSRDKLAKEIKNCDVPNTCWPLYNVRVFKDAIYDTYDLARKKARQAEDTSDLNSESEKRRIKPKKVYSSSSSESDKIIDNNNKLEKLHLPRLPNLNQQIVSNLDEPVPEDKDADSTDGQVNTIKCCCCAIHQKKNEDLLELILKKVTLMRAHLHQLSDDVNELKTNQTNHHPEADARQSFLTKFDFPLDSKEALANVNQYLTDQNNFNLAVKDLVRIGGNSAYEFVRRVLSHIMTNVLAGQYTFHGSQTKDSFSKTEVWKLLKTAAAEQNSSEADHNTTEKNVKKWLRRANERKIYEINKSQK